MNQKHAEGSLIEMLIAHDLCMQRIKENIEGELDQVVARQKADIIKKQADRWTADLINTAKGNNHA